MEAKDISVLIGPKSDLAEVNMASFFSLPTSRIIDKK
jgi:hypothetical protein